MKQKHIWVGTFDGSPHRLDEIFDQQREGPHKPRFNELAGSSVYSTAGPARRNVEPHSDPERNLEDAFEASLAEHMTTELAENAFDDMIGAAGPRALGAFRAIATRALANKAVREVQGIYINGDHGRLLDALTAKADTKAW